MTSFTFTLQSEPLERLDLSPLTPQNLAGMPRGEIEAIRLGLSRRGSRVGDVFRLSGDAVDSIVFEGGSSRFDCLGAGMSEGSIRVTGNVGAQAGRRMSGGFLVIEGSAGPHVGSCMSGGRIEIAGDAGDCAGGPLAGELVGMAGGLVTIRGRAGNQAGDRMRRGLLAILGGCGDYAASRMIAGTLVVVGKTGQMPGYLMRRGSILLDRTPETLSPSFVESGPWESVFAALVDRQFADEGILAEPLLSRGARRYCGDNAVLGKGEILVAADTVLGI